MKKLMLFILSVVMVFSLCACGGGSETTNKENQASNENPAGTYKSVSLFLNNTYHLNENTTYDKEPTTKGTYKTTSKGGFTLSQANSSSEEVFAKEGNYFYRTNLICCFEEDDEYGLEVSFDKNGHSNQSFSANYETIDQSKMLVKKIVLLLKEDGTYILNDMQCYLTQGRVVAEDKYNGTYKFENNILWLNYEDKDYPMLLIDGKLYFDVIEKTE